MSEKDVAVTVVQHTGGKAGGQGEVQPRIVAIRGSRAPGLFITCVRVSACNVLSIAIVHKAIRQSRTWRVRGRW